MAYQPSGQYPVGCLDFDYLKNRTTRTVDEGITAESHLVGRIFYPCSSEALQARKYTKASWLPSWTYARGYGHFLTSWGGSSLVKSLLKPVIVAATYGLGSQSIIDNNLHAPILERAEPFPVVLFSHGIGGIRNSYSGICSEMASVGFVVVAVEHADGTAATVQLAYGAGHRFYSGWGSEQERLAQTRYRMTEIGTAFDLLNALNRRQGVPGLALSGGLGDPAAFFGGRLDMRAVALAGHSYGGATVGALTAGDARFRAGIALDPWWGALPPDSPALAGWATDAPLLVLGSHAWNVPGDSGRLTCDGERQARLFAAAGARGGAVHLVLEGSGHDSFNDAVQLVAVHYPRAVAYLRSFKPRKGVTEMEPVLALPLVSSACLAFLRRHLPLSAQQQRLIDDSLAANAGRLESLTAALRSAAATKDGFSGDTVTLEAHAETAAPAEATPSSNEAGSLAAAGLVALEERVEADTVGSPETAPEAVDQGAGSRRKAEHMSTESQGGLADREALQSACQGHIWKLDTYGPLE